LQRLVQVRPKGGERTSELVTGIGNEPALGPLRAFQPPQHVIHRPGQPGDLVLTARHGNPVRQVSLLDRRDLRPNGLHRRQGTADQAVDSDRDHQQQRRKTHREHTARRPPTVSLSDPNGSGASTTWSWPDTRTPIAATEATSLSPASTT
jgi:hypothetical protein